MRQRLLLAGDVVLFHPDNTTRLSHQLPIIIIILIKNDDDDRQLVT